MSLCQKCANTNCNHAVEPGEVVVGCGAYKPPMTNADRIRAMSDEELCDLLDEWWCMGANNDERLAYADERLAWLQQSAAEEKEGSDNA